MDVPAVGFGQPLRIVLQGDGGVAVSELLGDIQQRRILERSWLANVSRMSCGDRGRTWAAVHSRVNTLRTLLSSSRSTPPTAGNMIEGAGRPCFSAKTRRARR